MPLRVFIGYTEVGGFSSGLAHNLAQHGAKVKVLNISPHPYNPKPCEPDNIHYIFHNLFRILIRPEQSRAQYTFLTNFCILIFATISLGWAFLWADACVFSSRKTLLPWRIDRRLLSLLGKRTIYVFLGSDSRPRIISGAAINLPKNNNVSRACAKMRAKLKRQKKKVDLLCRLSTVVVQNPLCSHYHSQEAVNWFRLGFPFSKGWGVIEQPDASNKKSDGVVRVLHSPSHPEVKGSDIVEDAVKELQTRGHKVYLDMVTGVPRDEVLKRIKQCDFVVDQIYSDHPFAGFASEAACNAKIAIVGGYGWEYIDQLYVDDLKPPTVLCDKDSLVDTMEKLILDAALRKELGEKAKEYVDCLCSDPRYADRWFRLLQGDIPEDWYFNPKDFSYLYGLGQSKENVLEGLNTFIKYEGIEGLCMEDRPDLIKGFSSLVKHSQTTL